MTANRYRIAFLGFENVLKLDSSDDCSVVNLLKYMNCTF